MNKDDWRTAADTIEPYCKADGRLDGRKLIKALQRYAADFPHRMTPAVAGEYVKASDYDALAAENAAFRAELAFARSTGDESALEYHALKERLAEAERDAARYRWLRDTPTLGFGIFIIIPTTGPERIAEPAEVDAAIDAFLTADSATPREDA